MALHEVYLIQSWIFLGCYILIFFVASLYATYNSVGIILLASSLIGVAGKISRLFGGIIFGYEDLEVIKFLVWIDILLSPVAIVLLVIYIYKNLKLI